MKQIRLKQGREKSLLRRHPWVFSGAIASVEGSPEPGETVIVRSAAGEFLAQAAFSPQSQIRARVWSWNESDVIDPAFLEHRIQQALTLRQAWVDSAQTDAYRMIHAESDGLPGLIVDRYHDTLVLQILSAGMERWRDEIVAILSKMEGVACIYERSDVTVRALEGLPERTGILFGDTGKPTRLIKENGLRFIVDIQNGQKTGFYLDQRENRAFVRQIAQGKSVLNCFCYTGGFSVYALSGGAESVLSIDSSEEAIQLAQENTLLNLGTLDHSEWLVGDVFQELRTLRDRGRQFDRVILDPPKFAPTASQAQKAARGYKDINLLGFKLLKPGGILVTFSCSGGIDASFFQKIVADAALDAGVEAKIVCRLEQAPDHPTLLAFPEGTYLKGLVCQI
jgi:23S rRNA (cytosine1962-C5)-methyltransferase